MKRLLFILCIILVFNPLLAHYKNYTIENEKAINYYEQALNYLKKFDNKKGIQNLEKAIKADSMFIEAYLTLADVYHSKNDLEKEIFYYRKGLAIKPEFFKNGYLNLAKAEYKLGQYAEAKTHLEIFIAFGDNRDIDNKEALKYLESCNFAVNALANPVPFSPRNLGINSGYDDYAPTLSGDETTLYFTVKYPSGKKDQASGRDILTEDLYISVNTESGWSAPKKMNAPFNTSGNEGAQSISFDGRIMFFTACNRYDGLGSCDIYFCLKKDTGWSNPINLGRPVNSGYWESQPSISPDGQTLYFVSNRLGGKGKTDIWKSTLSEEGFWTTPTNLGDSINTPENELSPFIHADNRTLYFSSDGWPGMGGYDIFLSRQKENQAWSTPKNIGYPINTLHNETGLLVNRQGNLAYFASNRFGETGDDLYCFELHEQARPDPASFIKGKVYNAETGENISARFELIDLNNFKNSIYSYSGRDGNFMLSLPAGKNYAFNVSKPGFLFYSVYFELTEADNYLKPYFMDIPLSPIKVGEKVRLNNIFFETNSFELKNESFAELEKIIDFLVKNPKVIVEISGHTDDIGSDENNLILSQKRAKAVADYLIKNGIDKNRLKPVGYGESLPVADNSTEEGRARNRRTEMKIISTF